jgi:acyl-CoA synthetase (AMP-forming)/AMP-acid ligase II
MQPKPVTGLNVFSGTLRILPDIGRILKGVYHLATAKPDKYQSLGRMFEIRAAQHPTHLFLRYEDKQYTYQQFNQWSNQIAHYLHSTGIKNGNVVALMMENRPETLACVLAITKLGAIVSMINTTQRDDVLLHSLTTVTPNAAIIGEECMNAFAEVNDQINKPAEFKQFFMADNSSKPAPSGFTDLANASQSASTDNPLSSQKIQMKQTAYYIFTSGTTGLPKASILTHFRWIKAMGAFGLSAFRIRQNDVFYVCLPLYHNNALTVSWGSIVGAGATMVLARKFSASRFWDDCRHYGVTAFCYIGELCRYLLNQPEQENDRNHNVRVMGGNGLRPDIWMKFKQRFGVAQIMELYGASECNIAFVNSLNLDMTAGYCPMSFEVIKYDIEQDAPILNDDGFMIPVDKGETGLLIAEVTERSPYEGYTNAKANQSKVLQSVFKTGDTYFNSGDLVQKQGYKHVAFIDRLGDTFRWKGENVATTEVEEVANQFPQIEHSVVYGVQIPNTDGRAGMAAITLSTPLDQFDTKTFTDHVKNKLPNYAVPIFIRIRPQQEITGTFKYKKGTLKNDGFDYESFNEPVFVLLPGASHYQRIDNQLNQELKKGIYQF